MADQRRHEWFVSISVHALAQGPRFVGRCTCGWHDKELFDQDEAARRALAHMRAAVVDDARHSESAT